MSNTNFDKGAALEILRYTVKTAAAPAVGGQAGTPAAEPGPLNPTGGATQGGSNNPQMQTGWAAGAMRKSLIKRFTANASRRQRQPVSVAASKQVGGMGSGMPKVSMALVPMTGMQKLAMMEKQAAWPIIPWLLAAGRAGLAWGGRRAVAARALGSRGLQAVSRVGTGGRAAQAGRAGASTLDDAASAIINPKTGLPFSRAATTSVPRGASTWTEPVRQGIRQRLTGKGSGFSNIYKHKDTGQLIKGPRGWFAKGRAPKGYELHKPWTQTGGYLARSGKKLISYGGKGGLAGYGGSYVLNPGKWDSWADAGRTLTDPRRLDMTLGGAALGGSFSSLPAMAAGMVGPGKKVIDKGMAAGTALARGKGGIMDATGPRGGSYLDILTGHSKTTAPKDFYGTKGLKQEIKKLDKLNRQKRLDKQLKKSTKGDQTSIRRQFNLDESLKSTRGRRGAGTPEPGSALARLALKKSKNVVSGTAVKPPKAGTLVGNKVV